VYDVLFGTDKAYWRWKRGKVDSVAVWGRSRLSVP
jgi:hypothetical protein